MRVSLPWQWWIAVPRARALAIGSAPFQGAVLVADLAGASAADHAPAQRAVDQFFSVEHLLDLLT
jgi:hypothetical protein